MQIRIGPQSDEERTRNETIENINFKFKAHDPYGFWRVYCVTTNRSLDGQFSSLLEARKAAAFYAATAEIKKKK